MAIGSSGCRDQLAEARGGRSWGVAGAAYKGLLTGSEQLASGC